MTKPSERDRGLARQAIAVYRDGTGFDEEEIARIFAAARAEERGACAAMVEEIFGNQDGGLAAKIRERGK